MKTVLDKGGQITVLAMMVAEPISLPVAARSRIMKENSNVDDVTLKDFRYGHDGGSMSGLVSMNLVLEMGGRNPLGSISKMRLEVPLRSRLLTGTTRAMDGNEEQFGSEEGYERVYVFPKRGEKYHNSACPFLNPACQMVYLTEGVRSSYTPCPNCRSERAPLGTPVFCFPGEGTDYHFGSCNSVTKYYVEMDRTEAVKKGYGACGTCGG